jgi:hypothetical protein
VLVSIMNDPAAPVRERRQAAEAVLARALTPTPSLPPAAEQGSEASAPRMPPPQLPPPPSADDLRPEEVQVIARVLLEAEMHRTHGAGADC